MKIDKRDWLFVGLIVAVLATFFAISGREKTKFVPFDELHKPFYETYARTGNKKEAEKGCEECHKAGGVPFPPNHPPKNRCLLCHKLKQGTR
jgi:hypothetical protein